VVFAALEGHALRPLDRPVARSLRVHLHSEGGRILPRRPDRRRIEGNWSVGSTRNLIWNQFRGRPRPLTLGRRQLDTTRAEHGSTSRRSGGRCGLFGCSGRTTDDRPGRGCVYTSGRLASRSRRQSSEPLPCNQEAVHHTELVATPLTPRDCVKRHQWWGRPSTRIGVAGPEAGIGGLRAIAVPSPYPSRAEPLKPRGGGESSTFTTEHDGRDPVAARSRSSLQTSGASRTLPLGNGLSSRRI
jgi:hypothetical protein